MTIFCNFKSFTHLTQPNVSILLNAKVFILFFANSATQFGPNNNSSDLKKNYAWYCREKVFSSGGILSKNGAILLSCQVPTFSSRKSFILPYSRPRRKEKYVDTSRNFSK